MEDTQSNTEAVTTARGAILHDTYAEPRGKLEIELAQLWNEIFQRDRISRNDNFFELGGNSLTGMELMDRVSDALGVPLPAVMLFQNPSPRQLAECIRSLREAEDSGAVQYSELQRMREQQGTGDDIETLLALPNHQAPLLLRYLRKSRAQFRQDLFVLCELQFKRNGYFVDFGASDGLNLSNTHLLEKEFGWTGILAEPARCWHTALLANRSVPVETKCVWSESGTLLSFNEVSVAELSTIGSFSCGDFHESRRQNGHRYDVETISLNDLLAKHRAPKNLDYLSIDTEGSELEILSHLDFDRHRFRVITCEHNFTAARAEIYELLSQQGYVRKYEEVSKVDDWYVLES